MIYTSLVVVAMSASAAVSPLSKLVHLHPHISQADTRISLTLHNQSSIFQDVSIDGKTYTVQARHGLNVKAPAGTVIYAASSTGGLRRGQVVAQVSPKLQGQALELN